MGRSYLLQFGIKEFKKKMMHLLVNLHKIDLTENSSKCVQ